MLEIRIDAMVRRIGSKPPGTNSIVSLSIQLLPFLVADILETTIWFISKISPIAPDRLIAALHDRESDERLAIGILPAQYVSHRFSVFFGLTHHRLDKRMIVRQFFDAERKLSTERQFGHPWRPP
jgi:hypothetical protein